MARDRLKKKITTYSEGVTLRRKEIEQSKLAAEKDAAELTKLKNEEKILKGLVQQLQGNLFLFIMFKCYYFVTIAGLVSSKCLPKLDFWKELEDHLMLTESTNIHVFIEV